MEKVGEITSGKFPTKAREWCARSLESTPLYFGNSNPVLSTLWLRRYLSGWEREGHQPCHGVISGAPARDEADQKGAHACQGEVFTIATHAPRQTVRTEELCCDPSGQCPRRNERGGFRQQREQEKGGPCLALEAASSWLLFTQLTVAAPRPSRVHNRGLNKTMVEETDGEQPHHRLQERCPA